MFLFGNNNGEHGAMLYWMATETESYIGRCNMTRSNRTWDVWLVYRWKELIKLYGFSPVWHSPRNYPATDAVSFSHRSTLAPLEVAFIGINLPSTNSLEKAFGLQARSNLAKQQRHINSRTTSLPPLLHAPVALLMPYGGIHQPVIAPF